MCGVTKLIILLIVYVIQGMHTIPSHPNTIRSWACDNGKCYKTASSSEDGALTLDSCKMFCNPFGILWPRPTGEVDLGSHLAKINVDNITIVSAKSGPSNDLLEEASERFSRLVRSVIPEGSTPRRKGKALNIYVNNRTPYVKELSLEVDESYELIIKPVDDDVINASVTANTFFGVRHGLETLSQLIIYDDIRDHLLITRDVVIEDQPMYPYRSVLLDTARNYIGISTIKRTLDAMATVKLNTLHWHLTDSNSFPFESARRPNMSRNGAYNPKKVYTKEMIKSLVQYATARGIRIIPEISTPGHVGEGWDPHLLLCFKTERWFHYCKTPPCGQLNPISEEVYDVLEDLYRDIADSFQTDLFHMGGQGISISCWNSSEQIQQYMLDRRWGLSETSYIWLWNLFQARARERVFRAFGRKLPIILWTSALTDTSFVEKYLTITEHIIQVATGNPQQIKNLLQKGYKLIISNQDALFLDCGFSAWIKTADSGVNLCPPYIPWQTVYENSPARMAGTFEDQIVGSEVVLWTDQVDASALDGRLWPRAGAFAERVWAEPDAKWTDVEDRFYRMRDRLVKIGVQAEAVKPEWCYQNEAYCNHPVPGYKRPTATAEENSTLGIWGGRILSNIAKTADSYYNKLRTLAKKAF